MNQAHFRGLRLLEKEKKRNGPNRKMPSLKKGEQNACRKRIFLVITTTILVNCGFAIFLSAAFAVVSSQNQHRHRDASPPPIQTVRVCFVSKPQIHGGYEETSQWLTKRNTICAVKNHHRNTPTQNIIAQQRKSFAETSLGTNKPIETFGHSDYGVNHHPEIVKVNETLWTVEPEDVGPKLCYSMTGTAIRDILKHRPLASMQELVKLDPEDSALVLKLAREAKKLKPGMEDIIYVRAGLEGTNQSNDILNPWQYSLGQKPHFLKVLFG